jgi:GTP-binding protein EngB required for normal cell division
MKTQEETVYEHLKKHKKITSWQAIIEYRITRLAEMIRRLKEDGHNIVTIMKKGDKCRYAEYRLIKERK